MAEEEVLLTKKGTVRKRKPKKANVYFTQDTEAAAPQKESIEQGVNEALKAYRKKK